MTERNEDNSKESWLRAIMALATLLCYVSIFMGFFPNRAGALGQDYATFLPNLLDGYIWFKVNGAFSIPWFTPSFLGGSLNYVNPQSGYFMMPQFLTWFFDPLSVVQITLILFAGIGFLGFFILLHRVFRLGEGTSLFGATLFLFNGFYSHRMAIGHFGVHPFMLLPWLMIFLMHPLPEDQSRRSFVFLTDCSLAGLVFAYMVQSWFLILIIPAVLSMAGVVLFFDIVGENVKGFWHRLFWGGVAGLLFSASKLVATIFLMVNFSRNQYPLPGAESLTAATSLLFRSLFLSPAFDPGRAEAMTNIQWALGRHEWEFSLTPVPLVILLFSLFPLFGKQGRTFIGRYNRGLPWGRLGAFLLVMTLPIYLNVYGETWNHILKQIPVVNSASSMIRWFIIPLPVIIVAAAWAMDRSSVFASWRWTAAVLAMVGVILINYWTDHGFYHQQDYRPWRIVRDYHRVRSGDRIPVITEIGAYCNAHGRLDQAPIFMGPNDMLVEGRSPLLCYEPLFGYRLETFPVKSLHPGPVFSEKNGVLNLKNPACYVWPETNRCLPGDHFTIDQKAQASAFAHYRPFGFKMPTIQIAANTISLLSIALCLLFLAIRGLMNMFRRAGRIGKRNLQETHVR